MKYLQKGRSVVEILAVLFVITVLIGGVLQIVRFAMDKNRAYQIYQNHALRYARIATSATFQKAPIGSLIFENTFENVPSFVTYQHLKTGENSVTIVVIPVSEGVCKNVVLMDYPSDLLGIFINGQKVIHKDTSSCSGANNRIEYQYFVSGRRAVSPSSSEETAMDEMPDDSCEPACNSNLCFECRDGLCEYTCSLCESCDGAGRCISSCTGGYTCFEGLCVDCLTDLHCPVGKECIDHVCEPCLEGKNCPSCPMETPVWRTSRCLES